MTSYRMSNGERVDKSVIDRKIREAKAILLQNQIDKHGYNFCEVCKRNTCIPVTCAHKVSVDECQKSGRAELAYDVNNMIPTGIYCHKIQDRNGVGHPGESKYCGRCGKFKELCSC